MASAGVSEKQRKHHSASFPKPRPVDGATSTDGHPSKAAPTQVRRGSQRRAMPQGTFQRSGGASGGPRHGWRLFADGHGSDHESTAGLVGDSGRQSPETTDVKPRYRNRIGALLGTTSPSTGASEVDTSPSNYPKHRPHTSAVGLASPKAARRRKARGLRTSAELGFGGSGGAPTSPLARHRRRRSGSDASPEAVPGRASGSKGGAMSPPRKSSDVTLLGRSVVRPRPKRGSFGKPERSATAPTSGGGAPRVAASTSPIVTTSFAAPRLDPLHGSVGLLPEETMMPVPTSTR